MARWRYLQMSNTFFTKLEPQLRPLSSLTIFENLCMKMSEPNHLLSRMYKIVLSGQNSPNSYSIKEWERELNYTFTSPQVKKLLKATHFISINSSTQEMSYKFMARWYRTPARLVQIYLTANECCWRGCKQKDTSSIYGGLVQELDHFGRS